MKTKRLNDVKITLTIKRIVKCIKLQLHLTVMQKKLSYYLHNIIYIQIQIYIFVLCIYYLTHLPFF